uniref:Uncharacterized protein n=1 Tax=Janibacter limosus TaxID=53458 RepID=A0AC61U8X0_9MICO|nr:hypothetical protein [Janibacter limosus]
MTQTRPHDRRVSAARSRPDPGVHWCMAHGCTAEDPRHRGPGRRGQMARSPGDHQGRRGLDRRE